MLMTFSLHEGFGFQRLRVQGNEINIFVWQIDKEYLAHLRLALFPNSSFEFSGILHVTQ